VPGARVETVGKPGNYMGLAVLFFLALVIAGCLGDDDPAGGSGRPAGGGIVRNGAGTVREVSPASSGRESEEGARLAQGVDRPRTPSLIYTRSYYVYTVRDSHDPFEPLLIEGGTGEGLTLSALILTGILWDDRESMIVLEDNRGIGYPMRVGDRLAGAQLVAIREDAAVFQVVEFGEVHSVVKELIVEEESPL